MFFPITRRTALKSAACGFGYLAFADLATRAAEKTPRVRSRRSRRTSRPRPSTSSSCAWRGPRRTSIPSTTSRSSRPTTASRSAGRGRRRQAARLAVEVQAGRQVRPVDQRAVPGAGEARGRIVPRQRHVDGRAGPPAGVPAPAHRQLPVQAAEPRGAGPLRPGHRQRRTCRASSPSARPEQRRADQLRQRVPAGRLPGHADRRAAGSARGPAGTMTVSNIKNPRHRRDAQRQAARPHPVAQPRGPGARPGQPGDRGGHRVLRLAFRMQKDLPKLMDLSSESKETQGALRRSASRAPSDFGRQCLLARRFVEAGVRFVEITQRRLGPPPQPEGRADQHDPLDRQADRRPARRPEAARPARRTRW